MVLPIKLTQAYKALTFGAFVLLTFSPARVALPPKRLISQGLGLITPLTLRFIRSYHAITQSYTKIMSNSSYVDIPVLAL